MGLVRFGRDDKKGPDGKYGWSGKTLHIWLNGTNSLEDWRKNFTPGSIEVGGARVSNEDYQGAMHTYEHLFFQVDKAQDIVLYGVSRGFATATLFAWYASDEHDVSLKGWAGKRVASKKFIKKLANKIKQTSHLAHRGDWVPYLPFWYYWIKPRWYGKFTLLFWKAHIRACRKAAEYRHTLSDRLTKEKDG